jgi:O-antigen ligase
MLFVIAIGIFSVIGILSRIEWGLLAMIFMIYIRFSDVLVNVHGMPSIAKPFIALLLIVILIRWGVYGQRPENWVHPTLLLAGYGLIGLSALLYAADPARAQDALIVFIKDSVIMLIVVILLQRAATLRRVIWTLLAAGIFMGTITTYQQLTGTFDNNYWGFAQAAVENIVGDVSDYRVGGPGLGPNGYGQFMLFLVPLALDRLWNENRRPLRIFAVWALVVCALTIVFTFSRGVFVGLIVVLVLMFIQRRPKPVAILITILLVAVMLQFIPVRYTERLATLADLLPGVGLDARTEVSFRGRLSENIAGVQMFTDHPVLGVGLGNFNYHYQTYSRRLGLDPRREARSAHNLYLEIASEMGLLGLAWFAILQWVTFRGLQRARADFKSARMPSYEGMVVAFGIAIIGFLVTSLFRHMAYPRYVWLLYGIALAMPHVARQALMRSPFHSKNNRTTNTLYEIKDSTQS